MAIAKKDRRGLSPSHVAQFHILRSLSIGQSHCGGHKQYQINELAQYSGVFDEKEIQRSLFILEGQKYVAPCPPGDFTSRIWHITEDGVRALKSLQDSVIM